MDGEAPAVLLRDRDDKRQSANRLVKRLGAMGYTVEIKAAA
jgi:hypothetical protein